MKKESKGQRSSSCLPRAFFLFIGMILLVGMTLNLYQPDRPVPTIPPASSSEPLFVVQVIRPRGGLPLGGLLPPQLFGVDAHLGFDSTSNGARHRVGDRRIELSRRRLGIAACVRPQGRHHSRDRNRFQTHFRRSRSKGAVPPRRPGHRCAQNYQARRFW